MNTQEASSLSHLLPELSQLPPASTQAINRVLHAIRTHLGMDVAFVAEFTGADRVFRQVDAAGWTPIYPGDSSVPLEKGYCQRVVDGRLPRLIPAHHHRPRSDGFVFRKSLAIPIPART